MSRSDSSNAADQLRYRVFTAKRPGLTPDIPAGYESLAWVANSATLIYGARDAVLVDTFLTTDQSVQLAAEVAASGKNLTHVYITHGHGDHFFGLSALKQRFPNARAVATAAVIDRIAGQLEPDMLDGFWRQRFPGQIPDDPIVPESLDGASIELEGRALIPIDIGYTDTADSTSLHAPSIGLIAAGDAVYNGIHPYLGESSAQTRLQWIDALDKLGTLGASAVVAGHKIPGNDDDPEAIAQTRQYLRDFIRLDQATDTPRQLFDAMIELYPERANPGSLWGGANVAKR
jgi:glyoxylase-like metal-dependent hydrolase (beta-lactamase superfamily II)